MNVTVEDILNIKPGKSTAFRCENRGKMVSARTLVSYCNKVKCPIGVQRYTTSVNWEDLIVTITAVADDKCNADMMREEVVL